MWVLCYLRLLPVAVMRAWFVLTVVVNILICSVNAYVIDLLRYAGVPRKWTQVLVGIDCRVFFALAVRLSPHIRIHVDESYQKWSDIPLGSAMVLNHTSFMDALLFVALSPWSYVVWCKTLMKASLRKIPIFGGVFDRVGHFPVYFNSSADNDFSVDRDRQAAVMARVKQHVDNAKPIALFPEGAVNVTPRQLKPFRHGSFKLMIDNKMPIYYMVVVGNAETWPGSAPVGGFPADIFVEIHKYNVDYAKADLDCASLAAAMQAEMQKVVDALYAKMDAVGTKKSN